MKYVHHIHIQYEMEMLGHSRENDGTNSHHVTEAGSFKSFCSPFHKSKNKHYFASLSLVIRRDDIVLRRRKVAKKLPIFKLFRQSEPLLLLAL